MRDVTSPSLGGPAPVPVGAQHDLELKVVSPNHRTPTWGINWGAPGCGTRSPAEVTRWPRALRKGWIAARPDDSVGSRDYAWVGVVSGTTLPGLRMAVHPTRASRQPLPMMVTTCSRGPGRRPTWTAGSPYRSRSLGGAPAIHPPARPWPRSFTEYGPGLAARGTHHVGPCWWQIVRDSVPRSGDRGQVRRVARTTTSWIVL